MNLRLRVWMGGRLVGALTHHAEENLYSFSYDSSWVQSGAGYPLCPSLPLTRPAEVGNEQHSSAVRNFFQNLLPEGQALDDAASAYNISKNSLAGLLHALGRESAGALLFTADAAVPDEQDLREPQPLSAAELSQRIRARPELPFTVWDGRVRLSIAGYQDKLAVLQFRDEWFLPETARHSSTHILKPEPVNRQLAGMTTNELMCMLLARAVGLSVANVSLAHVPEPVLVVERFDRTVPETLTPERGVNLIVWRQQCIDGCQALGLPVDFKYERPYGDGEDVREIRSGASLKRFFDLLGNAALMRATGPARLEFLRWVVFQVLIGNTDAHAKNLSFFSDANRMLLAPAYDLVSVLALADANIADHLAMAIGDNFNPRSVRAYDWALMAHECNLPPRLVVTVLTTLANNCLRRLPAVCKQVQEQGGDAPAMNLVADVVRVQCEAALSCAGEIMAIGPDNF